MTELKPCPFCGSKGELHQKRSLETWIVECTNNSCPASYMTGYDYGRSSTHPLRDIDAGTVTELFQKLKEDV